MAYIMLPNLQFVLFFICPIEESFKILFIYHLAMGNIIVYHTIIISNILNNVANCMKFRVLKGWLT